MKCPSNEDTIEVFGGVSGIYVLWCGEVQTT
jgi:hypothetical protein